jgi:hypothetical protein
MQKFCHGAGIQKRLLFQVVNRRERLEVLKKAQAGGSK